MLYEPPKNDPEYSWQRLDQIMSRRRLSFNPYTVSDERLMEIVATTGWGSELDLVQITSVSFTRLREARYDYRIYGVYMLVASNPEEVFLPAGDLLGNLVANDTIQRERSWMGKKKICNGDDVRRMIGKRYFVSRIVRCTNIVFGTYKSAYRFHRIRGTDTAKDAAMIREAMCAAKIEMLQRLLDYPTSPGYLNCRKGLIDYEPRVQRAIELIRHFPETPVPDSDLKNTLR